MFFHREWEITSPFNGRVIGDDHALLAAYATNAGAHTRGGEFFVIDFIGGELRQFQERRADVDQGVDALAGQQFTFLGVTALGFLAATLVDVRDQIFKVINLCLHVLGIFYKAGIAWVNRRCQYSHVRGAYIVLITI